MKFRALGLAFFFYGANSPLLAAQAPLPAGPFTGLAECFAESASNGFQMPDAADPAVRVFAAPSDGIEEVVPYKPKDPQLPQTIQGLWWMDGNPLGLLVNLGQASWDPATRVATLRMYDPGAYTFFALPWGDCTYKGILKAQVRFSIHFSQSSTFASLQNEVTDGQGKTVQEQDEIYTMELIQDGEWVRRSWFNGVRGPDYRLRRIVRADGTREAAYAEYLNVATATSFVGKPN